MKRILFGLPALAGLVTILVGADFKEAKVQEVAEVKKHCAGYTVIEAGLGVDCHGDTVKLVKKYGFYELKTSYENTDLALNP